MSTASRALSPGRVSVLERANLRDAVLEAVRDYIVEGDLPAGLRITESALAEALGVSRTPLREALLQAERDGLVVSQPRKGFSVPPLRREEILEIYPILWTLEGLAVTTAPPPPEAVDELDRLNDRLSSLKDPRKRMKVDVEWHRTLASGSDNAKLRDLIAHHRRLIARYEIAYMRHLKRAEESRKGHAEIARLLRARREDRGVRAAEALKEHWRGGMQALLDHFEEIAL